MRYTKVGNYYIRRPQAVPYHSTWQEHARLAIEVTLDTAVFLALFIGLPLLLWLVAS